MCNEVRFYVILPKRLSGFGISFFSLFTLRIRIVGVGACGFGVRACGVDVGAWAKRDGMACFFDYAFDEAGGGSASNAHIIMESQRRCVGFLLYCAR